MTLVRTSQPFSPSFNNWIDAFFSNPAEKNRGNFSTTGTTLPKVNVKETTGAFVLEVAAPGLHKEDFKIEIDHDVLTISSEKKADKEQVNEKYSRREFSYQAFQRAFSLPDTVDTEKIEAAYVDGILTLQLPKKEVSKTKAPKSVSIA